MYTGLNIGSSKKLFACAAENFTLFAALKI